MLIFPYFAKPRSLAAKPWFPFSKGRRFGLFSCKSLFSFFGAWHLIAVCIFCKYPDGWPSKYFWFFFELQFIFGRHSSSIALPLTKGLPQFGLDQVTSASYRYQSLAKVRPFTNSPAQFATLVGRRLSLVLSINFTFFNKQHRRADAATNTQTAASPGR